ncbi:MAG: acetoacetate--CoA ligase [Nitrososphaerales archaeon]|jgi:acetoacetyl-CoA synthetase
MASQEHPTPLWEPDEEWKSRANITRFVDSYFEGKSTREAAYEEVWRWSVENLGPFWEAVWDSGGVLSGSEYTGVLLDSRMPGAKWFEGATLNYAEHALRTNISAGPAIVHLDESEERREISWVELRRQVASAAAALGRLGVKKGDRVAAYISNVPESVVSMLAAASLGAVWSSCSPDFGAPSVKDRFKQIQPKVLVASTSYKYGGKSFDRTESVKDIVESLPTLEATVLASGSERPEGLRRTVDWDEMVRGKERLEFERVPFGHPLWILYSSGTTGLPKPIVHGHGGILLEHLKVLSLHNDLKPGDRFFWFTTTGWMMWNYLVGGLLLGTTIVLYDGNPSYPDANSLWTLAEKSGVTFLGTSAAHLGACMKAGIEPRTTHRLEALRGVGSTGSPLSPEASRWTYSCVKQDLWLASISGGTDVCTAFVGGCPVLPVYAGEIQCRCLGADVQAFSENGKPVTGEVGELVITKPMPSMPLYLWGDSDGSRYRESYFEVFPGVWRHGDWIELTDRGTCIIYGRSDATIKRMGVRIGTSEIYRAVETMPEVADCVAIDLESPGGSPRLLLFVVTSGGKELDQDLISKIRTKVRTDLSPRYAPDEVIQVPSVPKTLNGKKLEVPIKKIFMGADPAKSVSAGALADPASLQYYIELARRMGVFRKV